MKNEYTLIYWSSFQDFYEVEIFYNKKDLYDRINYLIKYDKLFHFRIDVSNLNVRNYDL